VAARGARPCPYESRCGFETRRRRDSIAASPAEGWTTTGVCNERAGEGERTRRSDVRTSNLEAASEAF
jgi:hypothetical protein